MENHLVILYVCFAFRGMSTGKTVGDHEVFFIVVGDIAEIIPSQTHFVEIFRASNI